MTMRLKVIFISRGLDLKCSSYKMLDLKTPYNHAMVKTGPSVDSTVSYTFPLYFHNASIFFNNLHLYSGEMFDTSIIIFAICCTFFYVNQIFANNKI